MKKKKQKKRKVNSKLKLSFSSSEDAQSFIEMFIDSYSDTKWQQPVFDPTREKWTVTISGSAFNIYRLSTHAHAEFDAIPSFMG